MATAIALPATSVVCRMFFKHTVVQSRAVGDAHHPRLGQSTRAAKVVLTAAGATVEKLLEVQVLLVATVALGIAFSVFSKVRVDNPPMNFHRLPIFTEEVHLIIIDSKINI